MTTYDVNVRAIVTATRADNDASGRIEGWDVYDYEIKERDADDEPLVVQLRCDHPVTVEAETVEEAIEQAKADATIIDVEGYTIDAVDLWVDEDIDIQLVAGGPKI